MTLVARWPRSTQISETARDARDGCRMAHNPEVGGSNPPPATKAEGRSSNRGTAFCMSDANGLANGTRFTRPRRCRTMRHAERVQGIAVFLGPIQFMVTASNVGYADH
jgi:hypothetical protein